MREASVGFQCPECVSQGAKRVRQPRTVAGGAVSTRPGLVTQIMIGINVVVFVLTDLAGFSTLQSAGAMVAYPVRDGLAIYPGVVDGGYWRLLTAAFLHGGLTHVAFNMLVLYMFGTYVEERLGTWRYLAAYLTAAVGSSVCIYWLTDPSVFSVGASGVGFALMGLALVFLLRSRENVTGLVVLLVINAVLSLRPNISWQGHLGGFVIGSLMGVVFAYVPASLRRWAQPLMWVAIWLVLLVAVAVRSATLR